MIFSIQIEDIIVPEGRRALDSNKVKQIAESISRLGQLSPVLVRQDGQHLRLIAGNHRVAAARLLNWTEIRAEFLEGDDTRCRLIEIAENLHRAELSATERDEQVAEWIKLTEDQQEVSRQPDAKPKGGRPEGGVRAAARELGISEADARRAVKVASLSPEAKQAARETGLDDNRSALLEAAKESEPEKQIEALKARAARPKALKVDRAKVESEVVQGAKPTEAIHQHTAEVYRCPPKSTSAARLRELLLEAHAEIRDLKSENQRLRERIAILEAADDGLDIPSELRRGS